MKTYMHNKIIAGFIMDCDVVVDGYVYFCGDIMPLRPEL